MKRISVVLLALLLFAGCAKAPPTNVPPVPGCKLLSSGACDPTDVQTYRVLRDVNVFLKDIRDGVASGKLTLNPTQKITFNTLAATSNALDVQWTAYHSGKSSDAVGLAAATNKLNSDLAAAQSQIVVVKP